MPEIAPVPRSKQEAKATYDRLSRWYDLLANASEGPFREQGLKLLDVQPGEWALELGFGTGHALVRLAEAVGEAGFVTGVDLSAGMAAVARDRLQTKGLCERVGLCLADAARPPLARAAFDALFMSFTLELFDTPELPRVLAGCRALLRPGGRLGVVALTKYGDANLAVRLYEWVHRKAPAWVDCRPIPLRPLLDDAGFDVIKAAAGTMWGLPVETVIAQPRG
jgi:demethylmenaquinone methyltransferase/2-methoxy-6-polyprenyl-1,4-benzoquinol methylase